jgi:hypothetical protein
MFIRGKTMKAKHKKMKAKLLYCKYCEALEDAELHFYSHHVNKSNGVNYGKDCHRLIYKIPIIYDFKEYYLCDKHK